MSIRWYTLGEFSELLKGHPERDGGEEQYATSLGDGLRLWATLICSIVPLLVIGCVVGLSPAMAVLTLILMLGTALIMVGGYLAGAASRHFSIRRVITGALQRLWL